MLQGYPVAQVEEQLAKVSDSFLSDLAGNALSFLVLLAVVQSGLASFQWRDQTIRLYVVAGVPEDFVFVTRTKKEIGEIAWHKLKDLPSSKDDSSKDEHKKKFWMVAPFVSKLRRYLAEQQKKGKKLKGQKPDKAAAPSAAPPKQQQQPGTAKGASAAATPSVPLGVKSKGKKNKGGAVPGTGESGGGQQPARRDPFRNFTFDMPKILSALDVQ